eukprot:21547-Heterococcus_DN1.PRE.2
MSCCKLYTVKCAVIEVTSMLYNVNAVHTDQYRAVAPVPKVYGGHDANYKDSIVRHAKGGVRMKDRHCQALQAALLQLYQKRPERFSAKVWVASNQYDERARVIFTLPGFTKTRTRLYVSPVAGSQRCSCPMMQRADHAVRCGNAKHCTTGSFNGWQGQDMNDNSDDVCHDDVAGGESHQSITATDVTASTVTTGSRTAVTSKVPAHALHLLLPPGYYRYYYISDGVRTHIHCHCALTDVSLLICMIHRDALYYILQLDDTTRVIGDDSAGHCDTTSEYNLAVVVSPGLLHQSDSIQHGCSTSTSLVCSSSIGSSSRIWSCSEQASSNVANDSSCTAVTSSFTVLARSALTPTLELRRHTQDMSISASVDRPTLALSHNGITSAGAAALGYALTATSAVQTLCLAYNEIGCKGATGIGTALAANFSLTTLDLSTNVIGDDGCIALCKGLQGHPALTTLNVDRCSLQQDGAKALADMLTRNCVLKTLRAAGNCIPHDGVSHIAAALKLNAVLQCLDLSDNPLRSEGAQAISVCLSDNSTLSTLKLANCGLCEDDDTTGFAVFCDALVQNVSITNLSLAGNEIGDQCAGVLAVMMANNNAQMITQLNLQGNPIPQQWLQEGHEIRNEVYECVPSIALSLAHNKQLQCDSTQHEQRSDALLSAHRKRHSIQASQAEAAKIAAKQRRRERRASQRRRSSVKGLDSNDDSSSGPTRRRSVLQYLGIASPTTAPTVADTTTAATPAATVDTASNGGVKLTLDALLSRNSIKRDGGRSDVSVNDSVSSGSVTVAAKKGERLAGVWTTYRTWQPAVTGHALVLEEEQTALKSEHSRAKGEARVVNTAGNAARTEAIAQLQSADGRKIVALVAARLRADRAAYIAQLKRAAKSTTHTVSQQSSPVTAVVASSKAGPIAGSKTAVKDGNAGAMTVDSSSAVQAVAAIVPDDTNSVNNGAATTAADTDDDVDLAVTQTTAATTDLVDTLAATASDSSSDNAAALSAALAANSGKCSYGRQAALVSKLPRTLMMVMTSDSIAASQQKQQQQQQLVRDTGEGLQAKAKAEAAIAAALKSKIAWETAARPK